MVRWFMDAMPRSHFSIVVESSHGQTRKDKSNDGLVERLA